MELQNVGYDWATFTHNHYYWYEISQNMNILDILINELKTLKTQFENALLNELDFFLSCMYGWTLLLARMRIQSQIYLFSFLFVSSLVAQTVKRLPAMWETWVWTLGWEDPRVGKIPGLGRSPGEGNGNQNVFIFIDRYTEKLAQTYKNIGI